MQAATYPDTISVDVEDYFHLFIDRPETWDSYPVRVLEATERVLALLDRLGVRGTFFVLGDAAARSPDTVRRIAAAGHEIASHGYSHQLVYRQGKDGLRDDVRRGLDVLQPLIGKPVVGYRASSFSVTPDTPWFWDVLEKEGIRFDSSVHPVRNFLYGKPVEIPLEPHVVPGTQIVEIPVVPARVWGQSIPFSGGFYLRAFPTQALRFLARAVRRAGLPVNWYLHPWELDREQPRLPLPAHWRFFRYFRLGSSEGVLTDLLRGREIIPMGELADRVRRERASS